MTQPARALDGDDLGALFEALAKRQQTFYARAHLEETLVELLVADADLAAQLEPLVFSHRDAIAWAFRAQWLRVVDDEIILCVPSLDRDLPAPAVQGTDDDPSLAH